MTHADAIGQDDRGAVLMDRFWSKVMPAGECLVWTGSIGKRGYGAFTYKGKNVGAHRVAYEVCVGPIPHGKHLDHLCRNPACVCPSHLEPVSSRENTLRGHSPSAMNARKTHCLHGHPYSGENLIEVRRGGRVVQRVCRICSREKSSRYTAIRARSDAHAALSPPDGGSEVKP